METNSPFRQALIHIAILRPHRLSPVAFLSHVLNSDVVFRQADNAATGTAQRTVGLAHLRRFALPLPPLTEQIEIVSEVERRFAAADRLAATLNRQLNRAKATRQSLLCEAISGKLVPQNPSDEPASVLLERIRATREAEAKKPRVKRMPKPKKKSIETLDQLEELIQKLRTAVTPERLLLAAGLGDDVERFFDLLRAGRDKGTLIVPVGKSTAIKRARHAN